MRVLVCGPPDWPEPETVKVMLDFRAPDEVIHNGSAVVDLAAAEWCATNAVPALVVPVDPTKGTTAEQFNIEQMLALEPDLVMSFTVMDTVDPEAIPQLLATDMAFAAGLEIDSTIIDTRVTIEEDPVQLPCALCGQTLRQVFFGEAEPHWSDLEGDVVCPGSAEARPDHVPVLPE